MSGLALLALLAAADGPRVSATASKTEVTVGEVFTVDVTAEGPPGADFTFPAEAGSEQVELRTAAGAPAPPEGHHRYQAAVFDLGDVLLPPIAVKYRLPDGTEGEVATVTISLRVASLLPRDPDQQKLADIRGLLPLPIGRAFWIALGLALALLAGAGAWLWRRRRPERSAAPPVPEVPPDVEALRALDQLAASGRLGRGEFRGHYIALVAIAKRYLERRLGAPVLEMTTAETLALLRDGPHADLVPSVRDMATAADRIKFARGEGLAAEAERHLEAARGLVRTVEARMRPWQAEEAA